MSSTREIKMNVSISRGANKVGAGWAHGWRPVLPFGQAWIGTDAVGRANMGEGDSSSGGNFKSF